MTTEPTTDRAAWLRQVRAEIDRRAEWCRQTRNERSGA
jgi:hypothetical protein